MQRYLLSLLLVLETFQGSFGEGFVGQASSETYPWNPANENYRKHMKLGKQFWVDTQNMKCLYLVCVHLFFG